MRWLSAESGGLLNADQHFAIAVFPRKSARFNNFLYRATWLLLALNARFLELAGTIVGTVHLAKTSSGPFVACPALTASALRGVIFVQSVGEMFSLEQGRDDAACRIAHYRSSV